MQSHQWRDEFLLRDRLPLLLSEEHELLLMFFVLREELLEFLLHEGDGAIFLFDFELFLFEGGGQ